MRAELVQTRAAGKLFTSLFVMVSFSGLEIRFELHLNSYIKFSFFFFITQFNTYEHRLALSLRNNVFGIFGTVSCGNSADFGEHDLMSKLLTISHTILIVDRY